MDHLWQGSDFPLYGIFGTADATQPVGTVIFLAVTVFFAILLHRILVEGWVCSAQMLFNNIRRRDIFQNDNKTSAIRLSFIFSAVIYSVAVSSVAAETASLWKVMAVLLSVLIFKEIVLTIIVWFFGRKKEMKMLKAIAVSTFSIIGLASSPVALLSVFNLQDVRLAVVLYLGAGLVLLFTVYLKNAHKILISSGFSLFYSILYLCVLEILPICVAVKAVVS